jgi:RNA-directed DNA polymerase
VGHGATSTGRWWDKPVGVSRGRSRARSTSLKARTRSDRTLASSFDGCGDADCMAEMPDSRLDGSDRKSREYGLGASSATAARVIPGPEAMLLMEAVVDRENMVAAYRRVMANKGAPGVDGMPVEELKPYLNREWSRIKEDLLAGRFEPQPVRLVEIPKPGGGVRKLGIPTVLDRLVQQALLQVSTPVFDPHFSESSFGFRPGRSAHDAVLSARAHVASGKRWVVDLDLEKFFDRVNHDVLMSRVARRVGDRRVLRLIRAFLQAGVMMGGLVSARSEGTPQGGPLSPLLSNVLLDDLDRELERRGHAFCRYADDVNIYVRSEAAGKRVLASLTGFLEKRLRLKVNEEKSSVDRPWNRSFLGYSMTWHRVPRLRVSRESEKRLKAKLRLAVRMGKGRNLQRFIADLRPLLVGWGNYFRLAEVKRVFEELDAWVRRKLRNVLWRQWKRTFTRVRNLMRRGIGEERAWRSATNGRGPWWNSGASHMNHAFPKSYFDSLGLVSLLTRHRSLQSTTRTAVVRNRMPGGVGGRRG